MAEQHGKTLVPEIRFSGFTDPWEQRKLSDLTDRVSIQSSDSDLPQVEYEDIIPGEGTLNKDLRDKKGGKTGIKFYAGDVLYGKLRPYLMNWLYPQFNGVAVGDFWVLRATECDSSFLYRLVQTGSFQRLANVSSGSKMPRADWNLISQSFFAVPADHAEQKAIAKGLAELDTLITLHQRKYDKLCVLKKSMLDKMFPKGGSLYPEIRFSGFTDPWEQRKFGDGMDLLTGFPFESGKFSDNGINLIRGMNVKRGYLDLSDSLCMKWKSSEGLEKYLLENEDILIQMDGALIGKSYAKIKESQLPALLVQRVTRARAIPEVSNSDFMYQTIQRDFLKYIILNKTDSAVPHLSLKDIREFPIRVPNLEEQKKIGEYLSNLDNLITLHQRKLELLRNIKKSMLDKMFV